MHNKHRQALPSQLTEPTGTCNCYSTPHTRHALISPGRTHYHIRSVLFIAMHMEATCKLISLKGLKQHRLSRKLIQPRPSLSYRRHTVHKAQDMYIFAKQLTNLVRLKTPKDSNLRPLDHLGDVVDGMVITSSVGMLTSDVLGGVGGPACHNKRLWRQCLLPWEHDRRPSCLNT